MMVPNDAGMTAFGGDASLKAKVLERLRWYEAQGDAHLKVAVLQESWNRRAQHGVVLTPYPKIARLEDITGLRISGDVSTLYAMGNMKLGNLILVNDSTESRVHSAGVSFEENFSRMLGVPPTLVSILSAISKGLSPEREIPWLSQFWAAIPVGASLWQVPMRLVLWALSDPFDGILGLNDAAKDDGGVKAVHDILALYERWSASSKAESPEWFSFYTNLESTVKSTQYHNAEGKVVYDLPATKRLCLVAAACAARTASVEETVVTPLPKGTAAIQIVGDSLDAPGKVVLYAGQYAAHRGIAPGVWYEACASVLLDILADSPVLDRFSR